MGIRMLLLEQDKESVTYATTGKDGSLIIDQRYLLSDGSVGSDETVVLSPNGAKMLLKLLSIELVDSQSHKAFWHCSECGYEYNCFHWLTCLMCKSKK